MNKKSLLIGAALAGLCVVGSGCSSSSTEGADVTGQCHGVNGCKGKGACGGAGHACAGQNACKGKGWLKMKKSDCEAKDGKFVASN